MVHAFEPRQAAYLRARAKLDGIPAARVPLVRRFVNGNRVTAKERGSLTLAEVALVGGERRLMGLDWDPRSRVGAEQPHERWRKANTDTVWRAYHRWLTVLEAVDHESAFALVPLPKIRASHIAIDTKLLHALMRKAGLTSLLRRRSTSSATCTGTLCST